MTTVPLLVAHSGTLSWDEALFFLVPVVLLVVLQLVARGKAKSEVEAGEKKDDESGGAL